MIGLILSIFTFQTICAIVPCGPFFGDPKPASDAYIQQISPKSGNNYLKRDTSINSIDLNATINTVDEDFGGNETHFLNSINLLDDNEVEDPTVQIPAGGLKGILMRTVKGRILKSFLSIPYAEPPVGQLRFRSPVPKKPWLGLRNAQILLPFCEQLDGTQFFRVHGQEDCLYLNIYTPNVNPDVKYPVMIYLHGGAFFFGNGNFGPAYLLDKDIILVSINYRLGPLGFISTGDEAAPGNFGLKDQRLAIDWVYQNIEYFGGNKSSITLVGQSAGAVSAHLHTMSNGTKDLLQGVILHSGSAFEFWAIRDITPILTLRLAHSLKCPTQNSTQMVNCMRRKPSATIVAKQFGLWEFWYFPGVLFGPVLEPHGTPDAFMTDTPTDLYARGQVAKIPMVAGIVQDEGDLFGIIVEHTVGMRETFDRRWNQVAPFALDLPITNEPEVNAEIAQNIRHYYLGDGKFNYHTRSAVHNAFGDRHIVTGVHKALQFHSASGRPTFGFLFNYRGRLGLADSFGYRQNEWGVSHCDDLLYLFNNSAWYRPLALEDPEFTVAEFLINVWTNFVQKGWPVFTNEDNSDADFWTPISDPGQMTFLEINDRPRLIPEPFLDRIKFWENLNLTDFPKDPSILFNNSKIVVDSKTTLIT